MIVRTALWLFACIAGFSARAPALAWQTPPQAARSQAELAAGQQLFAAARFDEAEVHLAEATRLDPRNALAWNSLGSARHALNRWPTAIQAFERAAALLPKEAQVQSNLAVCFFEVQDLARASEHFRRALELQPDDSRAHLFLARIAVMQGDDAGAEREFAAACDAKVPDPLAHLHRGIFRLQARRLDDARKSLERAVELDPALAGAWMNLGLVLQRQGESEKAQAALRRFRELSEMIVGEDRLRMRVTAHLKAANADIEAGRLDAALASALRARDLAPDAPVVHHFLAHVYQLQGRTDDARAETERAQALESGAQAK